MPGDIRTQLSRLRRRALAATYLGEWSRHALIAGLAAGTVALFARVAFDAESQTVAWVLLALALSPLTAWLLARRRFLSREGAMAWLDVRVGATGLVLTQAEVGDERWRERAARVLEQHGAPPGLRVRAPFARSGGGLAFALLALWIDLPSAAALGPSRELYDGAIEDLREKLETLEEVVELEEETRAELDERLERLEAEAEDTRAPEATFEALDELDERMQELAARAENAAEEMSEAFDAAGDAEQDLAARQEELAEAHAELARAGLAAKLGEKLSAKLASTLEADPGASFDLSALTQLSEEMRAALEAKLARLADAGLLQSGKLGKLGELGELGDLSRFEMHECDENCDKPGGT